MAGNYSSFYLYFFLYLQLYLYLSCDRRYKVAFREVAICGSILLHLFTLASPCKESHYLLKERLMGGQGDQWQRASPQENHLCRHFFNTSTGGKDRTNMATDRQKDREKISPQKNHFKTIFIFKQSLLCTNFEAMPETAQCLENIHCGSGQQRADPSPTFLSFI